MTFHPTLTEADLDFMLEALGEFVELRIDDYPIQEPDEKVITGGEIRMAWHCMLELTKGSDQYDYTAHAIDGVRDRYFPEW